MPDPSDLVLRINDPRLWECGHCHELTDVTHFYQDRATGVMRHVALPGVRAAARDRCGHQFDDDYGSPTRCFLRFDHGPHHRSPIVHWYTGDFGSLAPYIDAAHAGTSLTSAEGPGGS